jgi:Tfp pilus assembly protein PilX
MRQSIRTQRSGFTLILAIIILTSVSLIVMTSIGSLGFSRAKASVVERERYLARAAADGCAELGIEQVLASSSFTGSGSTNFTGSACTYTVTTVSGSNAQIDGVGTAGSSTRRTRVIVVRSPFSYVSWLQIP